MPGREHASLSVDSSRRTGTFEEATSPSTAPSPSSTALSVFVDELLGSDIDVEPDGDEPMTTTTVPTSTSEVSVPVTPRRPLVKVTAPKCDRCKLHSLSCNRSGKRTNCDIARGSILRVHSTAYEPRVPRTDTSQEANDKDEPPDASGKEVEADPLDVTGRHNKKLTAHLYQGVKTRRVVFEAVRRLG